MTNLKNLFQLLLAAGVGLLCCFRAQAVTTIFFDASQGTNLGSAGATSDTISSAGYLFTYTRDKFFTGGTPNPPGRYVRIFWPDGLEAQYVTAGPNPGKAKITVRRVDGAVFDLTAFTAKLLANAGAGRAIEIVPLRNGQEPLNDPLSFDVSGNYGQVFSYDATPNYLGTTVALTNYDAYVINLTLDYALMHLTVGDASLPPPVLDIFPVGADVAQLSWPTNYSGWLLQQKSALDSTNWVPAVAPASIVDETYQATISMTNGARWFRLRQNP
jgi:hypothetical protein